MQNSKKIRVHTTVIAVRWCDMDAYGHVNNAVFFSYFEIARIDWWQKIAAHEMPFQSTGPVLINATCTFLKPLVYPENTIIKLLVGPPGRSSYECYYELFSPGKNILYAEGMTKIVWVDRQTGKSVLLPEYIRKHLPQV